MPLDCNIYESRQLPQSDGEINKKNYRYVILTELLVTANLMY